MNAPRFLVMSGIPASGKSTLAKGLSRKLDLRVIDKDAILESLFDAQTEVRLTHRNALSREADEIFRKQVENSVGAIVISFGCESNTRRQAVLQPVGSAASRQPARSLSSIVCAIQQQRRSVSLNAFDTSIMATT
jgi:cytidylate kinase